MQHEAFFARAFERIDELLAGGPPVELFALRPERVSVVPDAAGWPAAYHYKVGDKALVKITAYDFSTYGGLDGRVVQVSADSIYDEATKEAYFNVIVETDKSYVENAGRRLPITPGMMTDTQIITGRKSILSYLLRPVLKARSEALRER